MTDTKRDRTFKLATTSFIVPDDIIPNVEKLGPYFEEIELLVFESVPEDVIPSKRVVKRLKDLSQQHDLTYNIHLPVDVNPAHPVKAAREKAVETVLKIVDRFSLLSVSTHTLHLPMPEKAWTGDRGTDRLISWQQDAADGLESLVNALPEQGIITVETLDYPFELALPLIRRFGLNVCIDVGHQIKYGYDLFKTYDTLEPETELIHLHGVDLADSLKKDHQGLDALPGDTLSRIRGMLDGFSGGVSLEVFNLEALNRSLAVLSNWYADVPSFIKIND